MNNNIRVVDILDESAKSERKAFERYIVSLATTPTNDRLIKNYVDLNQKLDQYGQLTKNAFLLKREGIH